MLAETYGRVFWKTANLVLTALLHVSMVNSIRSWIRYDLSGPGRRRPIVAGFNLFMCGLLLTLKLFKSFVIATRQSCSSK